MRTIVYIFSYNKIHLIIARRKINLILFILFDDEKSLQDANNEFEEFEPNFKLSETIFLL